MIAVRRGCEETVRLLLKYNASLAIACARTKQTALHSACVQQNIDIAKLLVLGGANLDCKNRNGKTPIDYLEDKAGLSKEFRQLRQQWLAWSRRRSWILFLHRICLWSLSEQSSDSSRANHCSEAMTKCLQIKELAIIISQFQ